jgi:hypothetical protein
MDLRPSAASSDFRGLVGSGVDCLRGVSVNRNNRAILRALRTALAAILLCSNVQAWGEYGHRIAGRAAAQKLPSDMPSFFRDATEQLSYQSPEPDCWRERVESRLHRALIVAGSGFVPVLRLAKADSHLLKHRISRVVGESFQLPGCWVRTVTG